MDYFQGFNVLKEDPDWLKKLGFGALFMFIPLVGPIVLQAWHAEIARRAVRAQRGEAISETPIPALDFEHFGDRLQEGLKPFLVYLGWMAPLFILMMVLFACVGVLASSQPDASGLVVVVYLLCIPLFFLVGTVAQVAVSRAELTDEYKPGFDFGGVLSHVKLIAGPLILSSIILGFISSFLVSLGYMCCFVGVYPAMVVIGILSVFIRAQLYQEYLNRGGEPLAIAESSCWE